jgi:DNA invertase Pin-like site-specific DNA recombinase
MPSSVRKSTRSRTTRSHTKAAAATAAAKRRHNHNNGKALNIDPAKIRALRVKGLAAAQIADRLGVSLSSVYRYTRRAA